ncbi:MAG: hypothetical protein HY866_15580 [Chloroflexi bacterium]|nr:hypothetical protein [Chloroflexota bacterium]
MEEFEYKGLWWLPQSPDHQVAGTLKFHPVDGAVLETTGDTLIRQDGVIETICGYTNKGDPVTLWKCIRSGETWAVGYVSSTYQVHVIFIGCHFEKYEDIVFDSISIRYTYLEQWFGISGFSSDFKFSEKGERIGTEISYKLPERFESRIDNLNIAFYHRHRVVGDQFVDFHMNQATYVEITPDQPMHYNDFQEDVIYHLRNFLSLGTGSAILPIVIIGKNKNCTMKISENESVPRDVYIFYNPQGSILEEKRKIHPSEKLFYFQDIADNFQTHLQNWFNKAEKLLPVFDLYFGIFYIPSMYIHLEFITLAQALETYHRRMYGGVYMPAEQYEPIRKALNEAIPTGLDDSHRSSIKHKIQYGYEYSLRTRLKHILKNVLAPYQQIVDRLIGNHGEFIGQLVDTRNYLTHYTEELEKVAITDPQKQYAFVQKMKLLIQLCFLVELDLPAETVNKLTTDNRKFQFWSRKM